MERLKGLWKFFGAGMPGRIPGVEGPLRALWVGGHEAPGRHGATAPVGMNLGWAGRPAEAYRGSVAETPDAGSPMVAGLPEGVRSFRGAAYDAAAMVEPETIFDWSIKSGYSSECKYPSYERKDRA